MFSLLRAKLHCLKMYEGIKSAVSSTGKIVIIIIMQFLTALTISEFSGTHLYFVCILLLRKNSKTKTERKGKQDF